MSTAKEQVQRKKEKGKGTIAFFLFPFSFALCLAGCQQNCQLVERELRCKEQELRELHDELEYTKAMTATLQQELCALRQGQSGPGVRESSTTPGIRESTKPENGELLPPPKIGSAKPGPSPPTSGAPAPAASSGPIKELVLGRGTGGVNEGHGPGDDSLQLVLEPRDSDGHSIKVAGCLRVTALEIVPEGLKKPLSSWEVSPAELRRSWKAGLFSTGYFMVLPWKCPPSTEKLRVIAQFETLEGRLYEADKDITVRLLPASAHKPAEESPSHTVQKPIQPIAAWEPAGPLNVAVRLLKPE